MWPRAKQELRRRAGAVPVDRGRDADRAKLAAGRGAAVARAADGRL